MSEHYVIISADCHGGAELLEYREYLEHRYHGAFDDWARDYAIPYEDLMGDEGGRNWDHARRLADLERDGIVAEVVFPNTIPPFYPEPSLKVQMPGATEGDLELRWAGVRAHNRWLADFCAAAPGRRAGLAQIFLNNVDDALAEVRWGHEHLDVFGGVLLPNVPPNSEVAPLWDPCYEPLWDLCEELGAVINIHSGSGLPDFGDLEA